MPLNPQPQPSLSFCTSVSQTHPNPWLTLIQPAPTPLCGLIPGSHHSQSSALPAPLQRHLWPVPRIPEEPSRGDCSPHRAWHSHPAPCLHLPCRAPLPRGSLLPLGSLPQGSPSSAIPALAPCDTPRSLPNLSWLPGAATHHGEDPSPEQSVDRMEPRDLKDMGTVWEMGV